MTVFFVFTGRLPSCISNFKQLEVLALANNNFTGRSIAHKRGHCMAVLKPMYSSLSFRQSSVPRGDDQAPNHTHELQQV